MSQRTPNLSKIAREHIWLRVTSVDLERSFSQYKHVLTDRRENLTEQHTKELLMLKISEISRVDYSKKEVSDL